MYRLNVILAEVLMQIPLFVDDIDDGNAVNLPDSDMSSMRMVRFHPGEHITLLRQFFHDQQRPKRGHAVVNAAVLFLRVDLDGHVLRHEELTFSSVVVVAVLTLLAAQWPAAMVAQVGTIDSPIARKTNRIRCLFWTDY